MSILTEMLTDQLIAELYKVEGKAEIVDGRIELKSPTGGIPGRAGQTICFILRRVEKGLGGYAYPDNVAFLVNLPRRKSFCPDAAFSHQRPDMEFEKGAPAFAVEVRSEGDYGTSAERTIARKRADYFEAGTKVVWDVDLLRDDVIQKFTFDSQDNPLVFRKGEIAEAVPGWTFPVNDLFE